MGTFEAPEIIIDDSEYRAAEKLTGKVALITGGDSGIGAATAIAYAKEGAKVVVGYLYEDQDAERTVGIIQKYGGDAAHLKADLRDPEASRELVQFTLDRYGAIDILVNNAATQVQQKNFTDISLEQVENTFRTNIISMFILTKEAVAHMGAGSCIINTTSVVAYRGSEELIDYSATKGAILSFTRSLSQNLASQSIRVNAVAPGPVWTPLVLTSFDDEKLSTFGKRQPLGRAAQPIEIAPAFVFLASRDAGYITGQVLHVNGGEVVNG